MESRLSSTNPLLEDRKRKAEDASFKLSEVREALQASSVKYDQVILVIDFS